MQNGTRNGPLRVFQVKELIERGEGSGGSDVRCDAYNPFGPAPMHSHRKPHFTGGLPQENRLPLIALHQMDLRKTENGQDHAWKAPSAAQVDKDMTPGGN